MAITTSSAKSKGRNLQKIVRDAILSAFQHLNPDDVRSCPMGSQGEDIQLSTEAKAAFNFSVECKARAKIALIYDAVAQADRGDGLTPIAVVKADRKHPLVVMDFSDFMKLVTRG